MTAKSNNMFNDKPTDKKRITTSQSLMLEACFDGELIESKARQIRKSLNKGDDLVETSWRELEMIRDGVNEWYDAQVTNADGSKYQCSVWEKIAPKLKNMPAPCEANARSKFLFKFSDAFYIKGSFAQVFSVPMMAGVAAVILGFIIVSAYYSSGNSSNESSLAKVENIRNEGTRDNGDLDDNRDNTVVTESVPVKFSYK